MSIPEKNARNVLRNDFASNNANGPTTMRRPEREIMPQPKKLSPEETADAVAKRCNTTVDKMFAWMNKNLADGESSVFGFASAFSEKYPASLIEARTIIILWMQRMEVL